jgi:hypothetical protein
MADIRPIVGTNTSLTVTGLSTLAGTTPTYVASNSINLTTNDPEDLLLDVSAATTNTPGTNKQLIVFAQVSDDGSNWSSGPSSGTTNTDEPDLYVVGVLPMGTATNTHRKTFSLASALGFMPKYARFVFKNDLNVALTSATVNYAEVQRSIV